MSEELAPRQQEFLKNYLDIQSDTFGNAYKSAIKAKFSEEYAKNITALNPDWLSENIGDSEMLLKAERNLKYFLDTCEDDKVKADITKFVSSRLGKGKWSDRTEHTGKDGTDLIPKPLLGGNSNK